MSMLRFWIFALQRFLEQLKSYSGKNRCGHGLTPENQIVLVKYVQYANEQG
jgi:hypothetical protein